MRRVHNVQTRRDKHRECRNATTTILFYESGASSIVTMNSPIRHRLVRQRVDNVFLPPATFAKNTSLPNSSTSTIFGPFDRIPKLPVDVLFLSSRKLNDCQHRRSDKSPRENVDGLMRGAVHGVAEEVYGDRWSKSLFEMDSHVIATRNWLAMIDNSISRKREIDALF